MAISAKTWYKTGSICMLLIGVGHTAIHFAMKGKNPAVVPLLQQMEVFELSIPGAGSRSLLEFHEGFSITMGVLMFFVGLQNFFLSGSLATVYKQHKGILLVPTLLAGLVFLLSLKYFIGPPQVLSLIALVTYCLSLWKMGREGL